MKYRKLGRTGLEVSEIGMGLEHLLPQKESIVIDTIKTAIKGGVNYFDCLSGKDFAGDLETNDEYIKLGKALDGLRDSVYITYLANANRSDANNFLDGVKTGFECFLRELKTNYTDIFMIAFCDKPVEFERVTGDDSLLAYAKKLQSEKKVKFIGISTHSSDIAHKAIKSGDFDVLMYPVNPAFDVITNEEEYIANDLGKLWDAAYDYNSDNININNTKETKLIRKNIYTECVKNNIGLIAMKPFGGGFLFRQDINTGFTPLNLISYVLTQNGVSSVILGCINPQQIEEILKYYECAGDELDFSKAMLNSRWNIKGSCQYCNHCLPCNAHINIGQINRIIDNKTADDYNNLDIKASECVKCGECEKRCPFDVKIMDRMDLAVSLFE
ncbi:MAG: aldo/keto reductase [Oscillospiraceae bacterium]|nr:aldo/keto reductase [Oscillospiraceae bacterium]